MSGPHKSQDADADAGKHQMLRVIDEEGEDLYPAAWFMAIELPRNIEEAILELVGN